MSGIRKEAVELAKENTANGIKLLEMQGEMEVREKEYVDRLQEREEREREYVARLQAGEEKHAAEVELVFVHYEEL